MDFLKRLYFVSVSKLLNIIATLGGTVHAPWTQKINNYSDVLFLLSILRKGDIILTRTRGELTTLTIPGYWKHTAVYKSDRKVIHAVSPKVIESWLDDLIMKSDYYTVLRIPNLTVSEIETFVMASEDFIGRNYDMNIDLTNSDEVFCSEIVYHAARKIKGVDFLKPLMRMGYPAFTPQDIFMARSKFDLIFNSSDEKTE